MTTLQESDRKIRGENREGLFPLIEIRLNGSINFEELLFAISQHYKIPYKLLAIDLDYMGKFAFGELLLHLQGTPEENATATQYLNQKKIQYSIKGYV
jgi:D-methionine transport system ATP-binding protein